MSQQVEAIKMPSPKNLPLILLPLREREDQSEKTLFKNDSSSSYSPDSKPAGPTKVATHSGLLQVDQIRKFLRRGDLLNSTTLRKLQQEGHISDFTKHDRSSASLYKTSRNIDFPIGDDEKQAEIKRLYLSHKKQSVKLQFKGITFKPNRTSQQVQTDEPVAREAPEDLAVPVKFHHLHKPSYMTIDVVSEQPEKMGKEPRQSDAEQNKQLPPRSRKGGTARAKALSSHNSKAKDSYLQALNKLDFSFHSQLPKNSNRYQQYRDQQTFYTKAIDIRPLRPLKDTFSTIEPDFKSMPTTAALDKNQSGITQPILSSTLQPVTIEAVPKRLETRAEKRNNFQSKVHEFLQKEAETMIKQATNERDSSLLPEHSSQVQSHTHVGSRYQQHHGSQIRSRISVNTHSSHQHQEQAKEQKQKQKSKQLKKSYIVQVPSQHQLKVGQAQQSTLKSIHPIRQTFGASQVDWIHRYYRPKNQFLKEISDSHFQIKKYQNGVYFGQLSQEGKKEGRGAIFYFSGKIYEGELHNDLKHGIGHEYYPDGSNYKGDFRQGVRHGRGVFEWSNGEVYDGQWHNNRKTGSGMWTSPQGQSYIGEWKHDRVEGFGVFVMSNGSRYEGEFKNSLKHGMGTERFNNGETYVGYYERNRPNGEGQYYWSNGDYFRGNFSNGLRHGNGYFKEGKTNIEYRGQYHNDKKCGFGQIDYGNGLIYGGNFENNYRHGYGELIEQGKLKYRGYWVNDKQVDDQNHSPLPNDPVQRITTIPEAQERQETITMPKVLPKQAPRKNEKPKRTISVSPEGDGEGYKRACGCNKKH